MDGVVGAERPLLGDVACFGDEVLVHLEEVELIDEGDELGVGGEQLERGDSTESGGLGERARASTRTSATLTSRSACSQSSAAVGVPTSSMSNGTRADVSK